MEVKCVLVLLFLREIGADITPQSKLYEATIGEDVPITWIYNFESDLFFVEWLFQNSSSTTAKTIMTQLATGSPQVVNNFNIQHNGNGNITLKKVTQENAGVYYCKVVYKPNTHTGVTGTATLSIKECNCSCQCKPCWTCKIICGIGVAVDPFSIVAVALILFVCPKNADAVGTCGLGPCKILCITVLMLLIIYCLIAGIVGKAELHEDNCTECKDNCTGCANCTSECRCSCEDCVPCNGLAIAAIVLGIVGLVAVVVLLVICCCFCEGHHPGGGDGHTRGKPDGRSNTPVVKDKRHEAVPLDERRQHHDETEKRVRAQPLPPTGASAQDRQETGSAGAVSRQDVHLEKRPMPSIPSEKHSRGLSANFEDGDPHKLPNVSIDLPQAGRSKNKLDPIEQTVDEEPERKKKKKKKKKERNMDNEDS